MAKRVENRAESKRLSDLIDYYEVCNRSEGKSPKTISWYSANLRYLHRYVKSRNLPDSVDVVDIKLLREYVLHLLKKKRFEDHCYASADAEPLSAATVHGHVRTLQAFFAWLAREGLIEDNLAGGLKPPKVPARIVSTLSDITGGWWRNQTTQTQF